MHFEVEYHGRQVAKVQSVFEGLKNQGYKVEFIDWDTMVQIAILPKGEMLSISGRDRDKIEVKKFLDDYVFKSGVYFYPFPEMKQRALGREFTKEGILARRNIETRAGW